MRYELSDYEWIAIKPMLLNKPRGIRRVSAWVSHFGARRLNCTHPTSTPGC